MFNVGIIGLGYVGEIHLRKFSGLPHVKIAALADTDPQRLSHFSSKYSDAKLFIDYSTLCAEESLQLVVICLPNHLHAEACLAALNAGHHVLCEKPMAISVSSAEKMVATAIAKNRFLSVAMNFRWDFFGPDVFYVKKLIQDNELGKIYYVRIQYLRRVTFPVSGAQRWNLSKEKSGGGALIDLGPHMLDLGMWLVDNYEPLSVTGTVHNGLIQYAPVDDFASGLIALKTGVAIQLEVAWSCHNEPLWQISVWGEKGGVMINALEPEGQRVVRYSHEGGEPVRLPITLNSEKWAEDDSLQAHVVNRMTTGNAADCSADTALEVMRVIEAWYASSDSQTSQLLGRR